VKVSHSPKQYRALRGSEGTSEGDFDEPKISQDQAGSNGAESEGVGALIGLGLGELLN
jgi:hypothetical protein